MEKKRSTDRIKKALAAKGLGAEEIYWEPVSYCPEGREGGWYLVLEGKDENAPEGDIELPDGEYTMGFIEAYNLKTVLAIIEQLPPTPPPAPNHETPQPQL